MIDDVKYYSGLINKIDFDSLGTTKDIYVGERSLITFNNTEYCDENHYGCSEEFQTNWIGKISFMYLSDVYYNYANGIDNVCFENPRYCYQYVYMIFHPQK